MTYKQSNDATIQVNVLDIIRPKVFISAQQLDVAIDKCYNDKILEKAIMQIRR